MSNTLQTKFVNITDLINPDVEYIPHENTFLHCVRKRNHKWN